MHVICDVAIVYSPTQGGGHVVAQLRKEYETNVVPSLEMEFEEAAWGQPKRPLSISCNFEGGYYCLRFPDEELQDKAGCEKCVEMYSGHGWSALGRG